MMATNDLFAFGLLLLLILALDAWFALLRAMLVRLSLRDLLAIRREHEKEARPLLALLQQRGQLAWVVQSGLLLTHFATVVLVGYGLRTLLSPLPWPRLVGVWLAVGALVMLLEWMVDAWAAQHRQGWALRLSGWGVWLLRLSRPLVALLGRLIPFSTVELFTEETLDALAQVASTEGVALEDEERHMLTSIVRFGNTLAREIMVPRIDMVALEVGASVETALDTFIRTGFSRLPVYRETIDHVVGLLYAKDLLRLWREGRDVDSLAPLLRPAYFVPEAKKVDELLAEMQAQRIHMAIVVDEYGGVAGLVTLEDIVEEIVGEIQDEYDQAEEWLYRPLGPGEYLLQGRIDLDEFAALLDLDLDTDAEEADTLGGLIYTRIGRVPKGGETIQVGEVELTVEKVEGQRIVLVRARRRPSPPEEEAHA